MSMGLMSLIVVSISVALPGHLTFLKFMISKKATKIDEIFTVNLTVTTYCQTDNEDLVNFCGLLRKRELYQITYLLFCMS